MRRREFVTLLAGATALPFIGPAASQAQSSYPDRPITLIVPYPAGGGNDVVARAIAEPMGKTLGQPLVIENRGGGGGSIGTRQVAKAVPDGYTLGLGGTGTLAIDPTLYPNVGYDPRKDFAPVGLIATSPLIILLITPRPDPVVASISVPRCLPRPQASTSRTSLTSAPGRLWPICLAGMCRSFSHHCRPRSD